MIIALTAIKESFMLAFFHCDYFVSRRRISRTLPQHPIDPRNHQIRIPLLEDHRGPQLDHVVERPVRAGQNAQVAEAVDGVGGLLGRRFERLAVPDQLEAEEEAGSSDVSED